MAYKDPKEILQLIADTVEVDYFIRPVINMKATNSYDSSVEIDLNEERTDGLARQRNEMNVLSNK